VAQTRVETLSEDHRLPRRGQFKLSERRGFKSVREDEGMADKICAFCNKYPAMHLDPEENGPVWGLALEDGSDKYCCHECWESATQFKNKMAQQD
jgi:hypothetical protein